MSASLDFSDDIRKSIITGYFIYALGLGSTLALQAAIQTYPEELEKLWTGASIIENTCTRLESIKTMTEGAVDNVEAAANNVLEKVKNGLTIIDGMMPVNLWIW
jgi:hypothetical protein